MFKNQLQELAQRSGENLPSYACVSEGPAHAPRFRATVTFNGEVFEAPNFCATLRQAEHAAAEVALNTLSERGQSLAARIRDETGACKNLLQETAQRACITLPSYSTIRCGPGHLPVFQSTVEIAGVSFKGESAKTKKQAEKNAATVAWASLKKLANQGGSSSEYLESNSNEERDQAIVSRVLSSENKGDKVHMASGSQIPHGKPQASNLRSQPISTRLTTSTIRIIPSSESSYQGMPFRNAFQEHQGPRECLEEQQPQPISTRPTTSVIRSIPSEFSDQVSFDLILGPPNQCWSLDAQGRVHAVAQFRAAAASLAPTVKIRQVVPGFSAPLCPSESDDHERESQGEGESGTLHALSQLQL